MNALVSLSLGRFHLHLGVPEAWGHVYGYDAGDSYGYLFRQFGLGPVFLLVWT